MEDEKSEGTADKKPSAGKPKKPAESREDRVAAALRANLRRRKAQARGRKAETDTSGRAS
ncbi:MAG: hypothetical protein COA62_06595 [Rhodobiaceae bacterium]|nr:MAG: hypothetical protein COA62_06595 [Rhodobiaceae bacterium]